MNLERVQKYYELIDRELGLESNDDNLFGFESEEEDLFGIEGVKSIVKKSYAFVMSIIDRIISVIKNIANKHVVNKFVKCLKSIVAMDKADKLKFIKAIKDKKSEEIEKIGRVYVLMDESRYNSFKSQIQDALKSIKKNGDTSSKLHTWVDDIIKLQSIGPANVHFLERLTNEDCDNVRKFIILILQSIGKFAIQLRKHFRGNGNTWRMSDSDKKVIKDVKNLNKVMTDYMSTMMAVIKDANSLKKDYNDTADVPTPENQTDDNTNKSNVKVDNNVDDVEIVVDKKTGKAFSVNDEFEKSTTREEWYKKFDDAMNDPDTTITI